VGGPGCVDGDAAGELADGASAPDAVADAPGVASATVDPLGPGLAPVDAAPEKTTAESEMAISRMPRATTMGRRFTDPILAQENAPSGRADGA